MKEEFEKAEVEVIVFDEKDDIVTASGDKPQQTIGPIGGQSGTGDPFGPGGF